MTSELRPLQGCETLPPMRTAEEEARRAGRTQQRAQGDGKPKGRRQTGQRFAMLNAFVDTALASILPTDALVWLVLYRDTHGGTAKTSQAYIARRAGVCLRTVGMTMGRLERAGLLAVEYRGGLNRGLSIYRLLDPQRAQPLRVVMRKRPTEQAQ